MDSDPKKIRNPMYFWSMRIGFWIVMLVTLPLFFIDTHKGGSAMGNTLALLFHCWTAVASYVFGYRLDDPPKWSRWVVATKWIIEWRYLVYVDPESIKSNRNGLLRVIGGGALLTILFLAFLSGKF